MGFPRWPEFPKIPIGDFRMCMRIVFLCFKFGRRKDLPSIAIPKMSLPLLDFSIHIALFRDTQISSELSFSEGRGPSRLRLIGAQALVGLQWISFFHLPSAVDSNYWRIGEFYLRSQTFPPLLLQFGMRILAGEYKGIFRLDVRADYVVRYRT